MRATSIVLVFIVGYCITTATMSSAHEIDELNLKQTSDFVQEFDPNNGANQWRLIPYIGWRKFAPVDAYYYDWLDYRRVNRWRWWRW